MGQGIRNLLNTYLDDWYWPDMRITDLIEILIIAFLVYYVIKWIKNTKAWMLLKGIAVLAVFILLAAIFKMNTILWLAKNSISVLATAAVIVFQPELRRALEKLGQKDFLNALTLFEKNRDAERFGMKTVDSIVTACYEMGRVKTGALIVVERDIMLTEYQHTGIELDCIVSEQMLINIFEHNTPLHDGAVIIRGNRILAATCYLPLSDSRNLGKELGTRHRAGVGISEMTDSVTVIVSEETGKISIAVEGKLERNVTPERLKEVIDSMNVKNAMEGKNIKIWKGRVGNGKKANQ